MCDPATGRSTGVAHAWSRSSGSTGHSPRGRIKKSLVEPWWDPGGTLVEPSWNLTSGPPRTPEPIWAETPKLSAVVEEEEEEEKEK